MSNATRFEIRYAILTALAMLQPECKTAAEGDMLADLQAKMRIQEAAHKLLDAADLLKA